MTRTFTTELLTMWRDMPTLERAAMILFAFVLFAMVTVLCKAFYDVEHRQAAQVDREIEREVSRIMDKRPSR